MENEHLANIEIIEKEDRYLAILRTEREGEKHLESDTLEQLLRDISEELESAVGELADVEEFYDADPFEEEEIY